MLCLGEFTELPKIQAYFCLSTHCGRSAAYCRKVYKRTVDTDALCFELLPIKK